MTEQQEVLAMLESDANQTWLTKRRRAAALIRAQAGEIERAWAERDAAVSDLEAHAEAEVRRAVAAERERWESVVFDGWRVLKGLDEVAAKRTTYQNVSDTLDALMRVLRA